MPRSVRSMSRRLSVAVGHIPSSTGKSPRATTSAWVFRKTRNPSSGLPPRTLSSCRRAKSSTTPWHLNSWGCRRRTSIPRASWKPLSSTTYSADDNPPIGLLLCTEYGETTVQYATEGLSQNLFVSKYQLQLPSEEEMRQYLLESATAEDWAEYRVEQEKEKNKEK